MGEISIEATCQSCEADFDEASDTRICKICEEELCDSCDGLHAMNHCFEDN